MKMNYQEALEKCALYHQEQLLRYYNELDDKGRTSLLAEIDSLDFDTANAFTEKKDHKRSSVISPLPVLSEHERDKEEEKFREVGLKALNDGKVCAVLLAGGMGTRLGVDCPKGMVDIGKTHEVYIFQRLIENLKGSLKGCSVPVPLFIMTSRLNDADTRAFLKEKDYFGYPSDHVFFFCQDMAPVVDDNGKILLEDKGTVSTSPNGNGGWFSSLIRAGFLPYLKERGIEWINVFGVDNVLQRICDPVFIGATITRGMRCASKVIKKSSPDERVGVMCRKDGRPSVVEYFELTEKMRYQKNEKGEYEYYYGAVLNYLFAVPELLEFVNERLPYHFAHKKVPYLSEEGTMIHPEEPNAWKIEIFIFDLLRAYPDCLMMEVRREKEFAPIKNREGNDSVETARKLLEQNGIEL